MQTAGFAIAFLIGTLAGLGVGSGGLLMIYLTVFLSVGQLEAQSINLVFFTFSAGASLLWHYTHRKVEAGALFLIVMGGVVGAFFGSGIAANTDPSTLSALFGILLIISGVSTLIRTLSEAMEKKTKQKHL